MISLFLKASPPVGMISAHHRPVLTQPILHVAARAFASRPDPFSSPHSLVNRDFCPLDHTDYHFYSKLEIIGFLKEHSATSYVTANHPFITVQMAKKFESSVCAKDCIHRSVWEELMEINRSRIFTMEEMIDLKRRYTHALSDCGLD